MKIDYRLPLALMCVLSLGNAALAASPGKDGTHARGMDPTTMTERMSERLELSAEQSASVQKINERFINDMQKQRTRMAKEREQNLAAMKKRSGERDTELKKVLSEAQYQKYTEQKDARNKRWRSHRQGMNHPCDDTMRHGKERRAVTQ